MDVCFPTCTKPLRYAPKSYSLMRPLFLFILLCSFYPKHAESCRCRPPSVQENFERSAAVFRGEILKIDTVGWTSKDLDSGKYYGAYLITFKILKQFKGNFYSDTTLIFTGQGGGDCGHYFGAAKIHVIYASHRQYKLVRFSDTSHLNFLNRKFYYLETGACDRTTEKTVQEERNIVAYLTSL